jgi:hypothetical protein
MTDKSLKIDRTITVSLILAIFIQTASALLWVGAADARIIMLEEKMRAGRLVAERLARLEEQAVIARGSLERIEKRLDKE